MNKFKYYAVAMLVVLFSTPMAGFCAQERIAPPLEVLKKNYTKMSGNESGAVVLGRFRRLVVNGEGHSKSTAYQAVLLLDEQSVKDYGEISIPFNSHFEEIQLDFARLVDASGKQHSISPDATQIRSKGDASSYDDIKHLSFSLPRIDIGATVEYQYRIINKSSVIEGHWYKRIWFQGSEETVGGGNYRIDRVLESRAELSVPEDSTVRYKLVNASVKPSESVEGGRRIFRWTLKNIPELVSESGMQSMVEMSPFLELSNIPDWKTIDSWASNWYLPVWENDDVPGLTVDTKIGDQRDVLKIVREVFAYAQDNIRYVSADVMRGGFVPHAPAEVLDKRYGDCKDQSVFIASILRSKGINAYPALVSTFPSHNVVNEVPNLNFNHSIVYIDDGDDEPLFLDTSGETGVFPGIDWALEGMQAFVIDGDGGRLISIPRSSAEDNVVRIDLSYKPEDNDTNVTFSIGISGALGNRLSTWLAADIDNNLEGVANSILAGAKVVSVQLDETNENEPFRIKGEVKYENSWKAGQEKIQLEGGILAAISTFTATLPLLSPEKRFNDYYVYLPYRVKYTASILSPTGGYKSFVTRPGIDAEEGLFSIRQDISEKSGLTELRFDFTMRRGSVSKKDYELFFDKLDQALIQAQWQIVFLQDGAHYSENKLIKAVENDDSPEKLVKLARHYLDIGEYEKALSTAKKTVKLHPDFGEAYYVLGIGYGFSDEFAMSRTALDKAKSLGYQF